MREFVRATPFSFAIVLCALTLFARVQANVGYLFLTRGQIEQAESLFVAVSENRGLSSVWVQRAASYAEQENWSEALEAYDEALRLHPNDYRPLLGRGNVYQILGYETKAVADWQRAGAYDYCLGRGHRAIEAGDSDRAIAEYELAVQVKPQDTRGYDCLAEAHMKKGYEARKAGDLELAISEYLLAIQVKPEDYRAYYELAYVYLLAGRGDQRAQVYRQAAEHAPDPYERARHLAAALDAEGDYQAAFDMWAQASLLAPTKVQPFFSQSYIAYWRLGSDIAHARELMTQAIVRDPCFPRAHVALGKMYSRREGQYNEAAHWFEAGLKCFPNNVELLYEAGVNEVMRQEYVKGREYLELALTIDPSASNVLFWLGRANGFLGEVDVSLVLYQQAVKLAPQCLEYRLALADFYFDMGRYREAKIEYETALDIAPDSSHVQERLLQLSAPQD